MAAANAEALPAYLVGGHAENNVPDKPTFIVPPGCVIIVAVHAGEISFLPRQVLMKFRLLTPYEYTNPLKFKGKLVDTFGSLAFYVPGDTCPNFLYSLLSCQFDDDFSVCDADFSGLIDLPKYLSDVSGDPTQLTNLESLHFKTIDETINLFSTLFKNSAEPSQSSVTKFINYDLKSDVSFKSKLESAANVLQQFKILAKQFHGFTIDQETLCKLNPGIHYNFICRNIRSESEEILHNFPNIPLYNYSNIQTGEINDSDMLNINFRGRRTNALLRDLTNLSAKKVLRNHISEAELQRKPAIRNLLEYRNRTMKRGGFKRRKSRNLKNKRNK